MELSEKKELTLDFDDLPFHLCVVNSMGTQCRSCDKEGCYGCNIVPNDDPVAFTKKDKNGYLAVSWTKKAVKTMWDKDEALAVELDQSVKDHRAQKGVTSSYTLHDSLQLFTTNEQLSPEDPWWCPQCKEHQQAFKKFDLWKLPRILVFHLKRFRYSNYLNTREKLTFSVQYPLNDLDISPFVMNDAEKGVTYSLFAVTNHIGSLSSGHYTSYCKNKNNNEWYLFDDTAVNALKSLDDVQSDKAYVLYYQRND